MALADRAAYDSVIYTPHQSMPLVKAALAATAGKAVSMWTAAPFAGVAPTTAVVPDRTTTGAIGQLNAGAPKLRVGRLRATFSVAGLWVLCDRLSHQGGLAGNSTAAQTTNLATAALTRYTDGVGVRAALEIYTAIGSTATTFTATIKDEGANTETSLAQAIGGTGNNAAGRMINILPPQGDTGVTQVSDVTLLATTGTAGNFGVTLYKPLIAYPVQREGLEIDFEPLTRLYAQMPEVIDDACLFWMVYPSSTSSGTIQGDLGFFED